MSKTTTPLCALLVIAAAMGATNASAATRYYNDTSAGGACHAANGAVENKLAYNNNYLTNIGTADLYVVCHFAMNDTDLTPMQLDTLNAHAASGATPGTVTCTAQYGSFYAGANHLESSQAQSLALGAGSYGQMHWTPPLARANVFATFTMSCKIPAGFKLGLIEYWQDG